MEINPPYARIPSASGRVIVVGDIHGCFTELRRLLDRAGFSDGDLLVAVGDLADRGPATREVLRFFRDTPNARSVLGNHDRRLAGAIRGTIPPAWSQLHSLSRLPEGEHPGWLDYLDTLPAVIETDFALVAHARLDPALPPDRQSPYHTCAVGGASVRIDTDPDGVPIWFHEWDRKHREDRAVCFGHLRYPRVELLPGRLYALDTGVVRGGCLSAVVLPDRRVISVEAGKNYYRESREEWLGSELVRIPPGELPFRRYLELREKTGLSRYERQAVGRFESRLAELGIPERINELRGKITAFFGEMPEPGPERGEYFVNVKAAFPSAAHRLLSLVLSPKTLDPEAIFKRFPGRNLLAIDQTLRNLESAKVFSSTMVL